MSADLARVPWNLAGRTSGAIFWATANTPAGSSVSSGPNANCRTSRGTQQQTNVVVDISATLELKKRAMLAHPSQLGPEIVEFAAQMGRWGAEGQEFEFGEAFRRIAIEG